VSRDVIFEEEIAFRRSRESQMEIDSETIPSPPSAVQRETAIDPVDPIAPVDVPKDIVAGHKRTAWARQTLQEVEDMQFLEAHSERARDHKDFRATFHP
jgi:hypothetical protein